MHVLLDQLSEQNLSIDSLRPHLTSIRARMDVLHEWQMMLGAVLVVAGQKSVQGCLAIASGGSTADL